MVEPESLAPTDSSQPEKCPPAALHPVAGLQTFLAFDFGLKRTGVASGNILTRTATPQNTIAAEGTARFPLIQARIKEWAAGRAGGRHPASS